MSLLPSLLFQVLLQLIGQRVWRLEERQDAQFRQSRLDKTLAQAFCSLLCSTAMNCRNFRWIIHTHTYTVWGSGHRAMDSTSLFYIEIYYSLPTACTSTKLSSLSYLQHLTVSWAPLGVLGVKFKFQFLKGFQGPSRVIQVLSKNSFFSLHAGLVVVLIRGHTFLFVSTHCFHFLCPKHELFNE